jgi:hypothetical protein
VIAGFVRICEHEFESDPGGALYPLPLLVSGGEVVGVAVPEGAVEPDADGEAPPPSNGARKKKGFLSRLFGKS